MHTAMCQVNIYAFISALTGRLCWSFLTHNINWFKWKSVQFARSFKLSVDVNINAVIMRALIVNLVDVNFGLHSIVAPLVS